MVGGRNTGDKEEEDHKKRGLGGGGVTVHERRSEHTHRVEARERESGAVCIFVVTNFNCVTQRE